jgi:hypothetical protein
MKKQPKDTPELIVDRAPGHAETRRKARDAYLNELGLNPTDDLAIDQEIGKRIRRAKLMRNPARKMTDPERYELLSEGLAVFLLTSEPKARWLKLQRICAREGVAARSNTRLIHLVVRALGHYSARERREAHRDSIATEYAMLRGATPSTLVSYFGTPGQGIDATYRRAVEYFRSGERKKSIKLWLTVTPKVHQRLPTPQSGRPYILLVHQPKNVPTITSCITNPSIFKAVVDYATRLIQGASNKTPVVTSRGAHRVIGKAPPSNHTRSAFRGKFAPSTGPRAKLPRRGS